MPHRNLRAFQYSPEIKRLARESYPHLGAQRTAEILHVSKRTVYRWCEDLTDPVARRQTARAARANVAQGERRRVAYNSKILKMMDGDPREGDGERFLALALALKPPRGIVYRNPYPE